MDKILFTEENLSKIHISQFEQFLDKHQLDYEIGCCSISISITNPSFRDRCFGFNKKTNYLNQFIVKAEWEQVESDLIDSAVCWLELISYIYKDRYIKGDLTQFHALFTQVYNEIMGYEIK